MKNTDFIYFYNVQTENMICKVYNFTDLFSSDFVAS